MGSVWALIAAANAAFAANALAHGDYGWAAFNGFVAIYFLACAISER